MLNETWLAVKLKALKQQSQDVLDFKVKLIFGSLHAILNNYRHIVHQLKSNLKCFFIGKSHCIERWQSKWIITCYEQCSFIVASFFSSAYTFYGPSPAFLGFNGPSMIWSFPLLQESSELRFHFCLHNCSTKCLSKVNLCHCIYISFPVINSRFKQALFFFWPPDIINFCLKSLFVITLVQSWQI